MNVQLIRHATMKINLGDVTFLVDPMFSLKGELDPVANAANTLRNPLVDLPLPVEMVLNDVDAILLTHSHRDHFDDKAISALPKDVEIFCQPEDEEKLRHLGFHHAFRVDEKTVWKNIEIIRTGGQHGIGDLGKQMGPVSGFVIRAKDEPSLYIAGDTIWCSEVDNAIKNYSPDIIVVNGGAAQYLKGDPITMGINDIELVSLAAPNAEIMVVHMESWNHCLLSRTELHNEIKLKKLLNVKVPLNGEVYSYIK